MDIAESMKVALNHLKWDIARLERYNPVSCDGFGGAHWADMDTATNGEYLKREAAIAAVDELIKTIDANSKND